MIKGSCLCGGIQFQIKGQVSMSRYCHCSNCRKFAGTVPAAWGLAKNADFTQTAADTKLGKYDAGSGSQRTFCTSCGAPLWFEPIALPDFIGVALGAIDEGHSDVDAPDMHLWVRSSPEWETIEGDLPQHETTP